MNRQEAMQRWNQLKPQYEQAGLILFGSQHMLVPDEIKNANASIAQLAMDAAGTLSTDPNSAIPAMLTTLIDPDVIRIVFAPLAFAKLLGGEKKRGNWLTETDIFPVIEETGEVSSYDDFSNNGRAGVNFNYPAFQSYLFQTMVSYGEREVERAGLMRINYTSELQGAAAGLLNRFGNTVYAYGMQGLQNYGIINNPYLSAYISPAIKANGGTGWFNGNTPNATANEVYNDVVALWSQVIAQTNGAVDEDSPCTLGLSPQDKLALKFTNAFGVSVAELLKTGFPNMKVVSAPQYGQRTIVNPQGFSAAGSAMQLIVDAVDGQKVAYPAFTEKLRTHKMIPKASSWEQKMTSGVWGTITRMPFAVAGMLGI